MTGIAMVVITGLVVRGCIGAADQIGRSRVPAQTKTEDPPVQPQAQPPVNVTPEQLKLDYDENEVAADAKYKDRALRVEAVVSSIDKNFAGKIVLRLRLGKNSEMSAFLDRRDAELAASLKKGEDILLTCTAGMRIMGKPTLRECRIR
jgi:hypothetical protein